MRVAGVGVLMLWVAVCAAIAQSVPATVAAVLPGATVRGEATLRFLGVPVYRAALFTANGAAFDWKKPMALRLKYAMSFEAGELVSATRKEMARIEGTQPDHAEIEGKLAPCFRDVVSGDAFVAATAGPDALSFWLNGSQTCTLRHAQIAQRFLSVWLSENSRSPRQSRQLRGE